MFLLRSFYAAPGRSAVTVGVFSRMWRNRIGFCLILAFGCVASQASAQDQSFDSGRVTIHGRVINALTQEPIGRALVYSSDKRFATLTDSEGYFELVVPGQSTSSQQADGGFFVGSLGVGLTGLSVNLFLRARKPGFLEGPDQQEWASASSGHEITIPLTPQALIKGRVSLSANEPAAGMEVQLFSRQVQDGIARWVPATATQTNSAGEFRLADLRPGTYKLFTRELMDLDPVSMPPGGQLYGYPPIYYPGVDDFAAASTIHLMAGQVFQTELSPVRQPYYRVSIPVLNSESSYSPNLTVSRHGHAGPGYSLGYNPEKHTIEGMLPSGNYLVQVADFGPNPAAGAVNITVAGRAVDGPGLVLIRNGSIRVNVTEEFTSADWQAHATWSDGTRTFALRGPRSYLNLIVEPTDDFIGLARGSIRPPRGPGDDGALRERGQHAARIALPAPLGSQRHRPRGAGAAPPGLGRRGARGEDPDALRVPRGSGARGSEAPHDSRKVGGACCTIFCFRWPSMPARSTSSGTSRSGRRGRS